MKLKEEEKRRNKTRFLNPVQGTVNLYWGSKGNAQEDPEGSNNFLFFYLQKPLQVRIKTSL